MNNMSFEKIGLSPKTLRAITEVGYTSPTPIQEKAIPFLLEGRDVIALAQTGSGKTASFILPLLDILSRGRAKARMPRSLIIEPTRELATQVANDFAVYGKHHTFSVALLIGGESFVDQEKKLTKGVDVLIVTPGRLLDLHERGKILLNDVKVLVIDEADRMLDMGFIPDIERIASLLPAHQTALFSATMPLPVQRLTQKFLKHPEQLTISSPTNAATSIEQYIVRVLEKDKREALKTLLDTQKFKQAIVFCNRKREVDEVYNAMRRYGLKVGALHGDLTQSSRNETMKAFKEGSIHFLIASDVAARGLDIEDLPVVINFHVPTNPEDYIHRIGRTGRAGKEGKSFTFVSPHEQKHLTLIFNVLDKVIEEYSLNLEPHPTKTKSKPSAIEKKRPPFKKTQIAQESLSSLKPDLGFGEHVPAFMYPKK